MDTELEWVGTAESKGADGWKLIVSDELNIRLLLQENAYYVQMSFRGGPMLGRTYRGEWIGVGDVLTLEEAQAEAVERAGDIVSEMLSNIHEAMKQMGHEVEPIVPDGALDHKGRP